MFQLALFEMADSDLEQLLERAIAEQPYYTCARCGSEVADTAYDSDMHELGHDLGALEAEIEADRREAMENRNAAP